MTILQDGFTFYQIIIITVSTFNILVGMVKVFNKKKTPREFLVLIIFWLIFSLLALYPHISGLLADVTGFELGINALLVSISIFLFFSVLKLSITCERIENTITKLVREEEMKDLKSKD